MKKNIFKLGLTIFIILFVLIGCDQNNNVEPVVNLDMKKTGSIEFGLMKSGGSAGIDTVTASLIRSGYFTIKKNLYIENETASSVINDIGTGKWKLLVEAKNNEGEVLYRGEKYITILENKVTHVNINLVAVTKTGTLAINVTWKDNDGTEWTKFSGNPVLNIGGAGAWDATRVRHPNVIFDGEIYKMWYTGCDENTYQIGYAESKNGINWVRYSGNPVLTISDDGAWDDTHVNAPSVFFDGTEYKMWYCGHDGSTYRIGYATSPDGKNWTKYSGNPILNIGTSASWEKIISTPSVVFDGEKYKMWYSGSNGTNFNVGYAESQNGVDWVKHSGNPVISIGALGSWDDVEVENPCVIFDGKSYMMWYDGNDGNKHRLGLATSSDGINWVKSPSNPVMDAGSPASWDGYKASTACVLYDGINFKMWYEGYNGTSYKIGFSISEL